MTKPRKLGAVFVALAGAVGTVLLLADPHVPRVLAENIATESPVAESSVVIDVQALQPGDIIFRKGRSLGSRAVLAVDEESAFSHVGLLSERAGELQVIHAVPADAEHQSLAIRMEPLSAFLAPDKASDAAVFRAQDLEHEVRLRAARAALGFIAEGLEFDEAYDLRTPDRLYCTELVWRAYLETGTDLVDGRFDHLNLPLRSGDYLLPSRLLASPHLQLVDTSNRSRSSR